MDSRRAQPGFSVAMRRMSVRRSALIEGRPVGRDRQRQKKAEAEAVPANDGRGPHDGERVAPAGPALCEADPEGAVEGAESPPGPPPGKDRELLGAGRGSPERGRRGNRTRCGRRREGAQQGEHTSLGRRTDRWQQVAPPSGETARRCASAPTRGRAGVRGRTFPVGTTVRGIEQIPWIYDAMCAFAE